MVGKLHRVDEVGVEPQRLQGENSGAVTDAACDKMRVSDECEGEDEEEAPRAT
jgi:hypothetical protein